MTMRRFNAWLHCFAKSREYALVLDLLVISIAAAIVIGIPARLLQIAGGL